MTAMAAGGLLGSAGLPLSMFGREQSVGVPGATVGSSSSAGA